MSSTFRAADIDRVFDDGGDVMEFSTHPIRSWRMRPLWIRVG